MADIDSFFLIDTCNLLHGRTLEVGGFANLYEKNCSCLVSFFSLALRYYYLIFYTTEKHWIGH
jgi:hypothetical protein